MISINNATFTYPSGKGVFNLNFEVKKGEILGYLGSNGAGKTTTIRQLMGFIKPNEGSCTIAGLDCYKDAPKIKKTLGYIPGEIAFPDNIDGMEFLKFCCHMRGQKDYTKLNELVDLFELDLKGKIKKYSKGMKQKVGIVIAFMHNPDVLILDEPTSGLDPLMQNRFIDLIAEEKKNGKTILLSSHIFEEVERTCTNVIIIKDGRIVVESDIATLNKSKRRGYIVHTPDVDKLKSFGFEMQGDNEIYIKGDETNDLIKKLSTINVTTLDIKSQNLEEIFLSFYSRESK